MAEGPKHDNQAQHSTAPEEEQHSTPSHTRYVRPRTPHRTVEPVNDLEQDDALAEVTHESDFTLGTLNPLAGRGYRRSRNDMNRISRDLHYGQYLSIPKGRRGNFRLTRTQTQSQINCFTCCPCCNACHCGGYCVATHFECLKHNF